MLYEHLSEPALLLGRNQEKTDGKWHERGKYELVRDVPARSLGRRDGRIVESTGVFSGTLRGIISAARELS